jgi:hypothetical protein
MVESLGLRVRALVIPDHVHQCNSSGTCMWIACDSCTQKTQRDPLKRVLAPGFNGLAPRLLRGKIKLRKLITSTRYIVWRTMVEWIESSAQDSMVEWIESLAQDESIV